MISGSVHRLGRWTSMLTLGAGLVFVAQCSSAQPGAGRGGSAKEVVELFRRMDSHGERLTNEGWLKVAALFVRPGRPPREPVLRVVTGEIVGQEVVAGNRAEVWTEGTEWGTIDSLARFSRVIGHPASIRGVDAPKEPMEGPIRVRHQYKLVLTDHYWELSGVGVSPTEAYGSTAWRIESFDPERRVTMEAAIRYLKTLSHRSNDPAVRKNAGRSIAAISRLYHSNAAKAR